MSDSTNGVLPELEAENNISGGIDRVIQGLLDLKLDLEWHGHTFSPLRLQEELWEGFFSYVRTGLALKNIARYCRYDKKLKNFKQFCERQIGISVGYAKKIIQAAEVCIELMEAGFKVLPKCIAQAIPLIRYSFANSGQGLIEKWQQVVGFAAGTKQRLTASLVKQVVENSEPMKRVEMNWSTWELVLKKCPPGMTNKEFLHEAIANFNPDDEIIEPLEETEEIELASSLSPKARKRRKKNKQQRWQKDLQKLIQEHEQESPEDRGIP